MRRRFLRCLRNSTGATHSLCSTGRNGYHYSNNQCCHCEQTKEGGFHGLCRVCEFFNSKLFIVNANLLLFVATAKINLCEFILLLLAAVLCTISLLPSL